MKDWRILATKNWKDVHSPGFRRFHVEGYRWPFPHPLGPLAQRVLRTMGKNPLQAPLNSPHAFLHLPLKNPLLLHEGSLNKKHKEKATW
jgi:hypothetical protein